MTERLYYTDAYLREFEARIVGRLDHCDRPAVLLDRTAFYPTSGGQPFDTGWLGQARVVEVVDAPDGRLLHVLEGPVPEGAVAGRIDWSRRFEHMQQHTGQHVLSATFERLLGVRTTSVHLGSAAATIDLEREVTPEEIDAAEAAACEVVWENRPVTITLVEAQDAVALPLRKVSSRTGPLRIVEVEGVDTSACGGTHVSRTGAVGIITVSAWERFRGRTRIEFRCGGRTLRAHRALRDTVAAAVRLISVAPDALPGGIERLQADNKALRARVEDLERRLARHEADRLAAGAHSAGGIRLVVEAVPDADLATMKTIARHIASRPQHAAVLFTAEIPAAVVIARAPDVSLDASVLLKALTAQFGGRGGGRSETAQAAGLDAPADRLVSAAHAAVRDFQSGSPVDPL